MTDVILKLDEASSVTDGSKQREYGDNFDILFPDEIRDADIKDFSLWRSGHILGAIRRADHEVETVGDLVDLLSEYKGDLTAIDGIGPKYQHEIEVALHLVMAKECQVCHKIKLVRVFASPLGAISFRYCNDCIEAEAEPYFALVASCVGLSGPRGVADWIKPIITKTLRFHKKTRKRFWKDVAQLEEEYLEEMSRLAEEDLDEDPWFPGTELEEE